MYPCVRVLAHPEAGRICRRPRVPDVVSSRGCHADEAPPVLLCMRRCWRYVLALVAHPPGIVARGSLRALLCEAVLSMNVPYTLITEHTL